MAVMEVILKAVDQVSGVVEGIGAKTGQAAGFMEKNWMAIGAGAAVAGGAMMKVTGRAEELNEGIRRVSHLTGESEESLRSMTQALTDHTFSNDDAVAAMERLIQSGVNQKDQFEALLPAFDNFSDATGKDMVASIDMFDRTLSALGIPLEEAEDHMDTLTHVMTQTDIPLGTLQRNLGRVPDELQAMNFGLDDSVAAIQYFRDQGYSGEEAVRNFRRAVAESEGDLDAFMEITGMTAEELAHYQEQVGEAAGLTDVLAESNNQNIGIFQKLKAQVDDAMWSMGSFLEPVRDLGPLMMGLGPAIKGASAGMRALGGVSIKGLVPGFLGAAKATWAFSAALLANPITWIVLLIVGLIAAIVLLWRNWDQVSEWLVKAWEWIKEKAIAVWDSLKEFFSGFWDSVKESFVSAWEGIKDFFSGVWEWIKEFFAEWGPVILAVVAPFIGLPLLIAQHWDTIKEFLSGVWESVKEIFSSAIDTVTEYLQDRFEATRDFLVGLWEGVRDFFVDVWESIKGVFSGGTTSIWDGIKERFEAVKEFIVGIWETVRDFFLEVWERIKGVFDMSLEDIWSAIKDAWTNYLNFITGMGGNIEDVISGAWTRIKDFFGRVLKDIIQAITTWVSNMQDKAREAGQKALDGFMSIIGGLPGKLGEVLKKAVQALMNVGGQLWDAAKGAGSKIWGGIKNGLGIKSPSYVEKAIDAMADRAKKLPGEMGQAFSRMPNLDPGWDPEGTLAFAGGGSSGSRVQEHRHSGTIRVTGDDLSGGRFEQIIDVVKDELRREVRG